MFAISLVVLFGLLVGLGSGDVYEGGFFGFWLVGCSCLICVGGLLLFYFTFIFLLGLFASVVWLFSCGCCYLLLFCCFVYFWLCWSGCLCVVFRLLCLLWWAVDLVCLVVWWFAGGWTVLRYRLDVELVGRVVVR